jgi:hypothetical protein
VVLQCWLRLGSDARVSWCDEGSRSPRVPVDAGLRTISRLRLSANLLQGRIFDTNVSFDGAAAAA